MTKLQKQKAEYRAVHHEEILKQQAEYRAAGRVNHKNQRNCSRKHYAVHRNALLPVMRQYAATHREETAWRDMHYRAGNADGKHSSYANVRVCWRWHEDNPQGKANFILDMGERPEGTSLGRILDRGNYELGNAFWQTQAEQSLARRNNHALAKWEAANA